MKLEITTSIKNAEMANFILARGVESLKTNNVFKNHYQITDADIVSADKFRKSLVKAISNSL